MNDEMMCQRFKALLDKYMDDELNNDEKAFMKAHAEKCVSCKNELSMIDSVKSVIGHLDDDIVVPLSAQAAWRNAIRKEIRQKKARKLYKGLTSVAAAVVVLVTTTFAMRASGALPERTAAAPEAEGMPAVVRMSDNYDQAEAVSSAKMRTANAPAIVIEADGETDDMIIGVAEDENIIKSCEVVKETSDIENDILTLHELTEEYEGYVSEFTRDFANAAGYAAIVSRIPDDLLDDYISALDDVAETVSVTRLNQNADEIYFGVDERLASKRAIAEEMNLLISGADGEKLNELNLQLNAVYEEIDALQRLVNTRDNDLKYAKVRITLIGKETAPVTPAESTLSERSATGFKQSLTAIGRFLQDMVVSVAVIAPAVFLIAVVALAAVLIIKGVKKARKDGEE